MKKTMRVIAVALLLVSTALAQSGGGPVVAPGDNLVVEGVPPIPAALADEVRRYTEFRTAGLASWHPARREMLIGTRFGDTPQIHLVRMPNGARTQLTFFPDRVTGALFHPKDGSYFVFSKDGGGNEFYQFYRYDMATGDVTLLTDGKSRDTDPVWSHGGDLLAYGSTRRNGADVDLYVTNPADPKSDRALAQLQGGGWTPLDFSPDDKKILVEEGVSANESYLWVMDSATGAKELLTPKGGADKVSYEGGEFSKDGKGVYTTTDNDSEFHRLAYVDLSTKQHT